MALPTLKGTIGQDNRVRVSSARPGRHGALTTPQAILRHRWLILELTKREVRLRYRGTWLGFLWSTLNPLIMTAVYTVVFVVFLRVDIPKYPVFLFAGLLPWNWFSEAILSATNCFIARSNFLRDAVFPAEVLPVTSVMAAMMNYIFSLPILILLLVVFRVAVGWSLLALPVIMAIQVLFTMSFVFLLATFDVFLRDLNYIVQHVLMAAFFLTPIMYNISSVPERFHLLMQLDPMTHVISAYQNIFYYHSWPAWQSLSYIIAFSVILTAVGFWVFEANREHLAEYL